MSAQKKTAKDSTCYSTTAASRLLGLSRPTLLKYQKELAIRLREQVLVLRIRRKLWTPNQLREVLESLPSGRMGSRVRANALRVGLIS